MCNLTWDNFYVALLNEKLTGKKKQFPVTQEEADEFLRKWKKLVSQAQLGNENSLRIVKDIAWEAYVFHVQYFASYTWEDLLSKVADKDPSAISKHESHVEDFNYDFKVKLESGFSS